MNKHQRYVFRKVARGLCARCTRRRGNVRHEFFEQRAELIFLARLGAVVTGPISADSLILVVACGEWPSAGAVKGTSHS